MMDTTRTYRPIVVSGIPRSGTSCIMQMLDAGGMECLVDPEYREADADNPLGYYEIDIPQRMKTSSCEWLEDARGKAVKIVAYWLERLPEDVDVRVIYVQRDYEEILASQGKMMRRRGVDDQERQCITADQLRRHDAQVLKHVKSCGWPCLVVKHFDLFTGVSDVIDSIERFVPWFVIEDAGAMADVVDPALYRNRN